MILAGHPSGSTTSAPEGSRARPYLQWICSSLIWSTSARLGISVASETGLPSTGQQAPECPACSVMQAWQKLWPQTPAMTGSWKRPWCSAHCSEGGGVAQKRVGSCSASSTTTSACWCSVCPASPISMNAMEGRLVSEEGEAWKAG